MLEGPLTVVTPEKRVLFFIFFEPSLLCRLTKKVNLRFSNENSITNFCQTWYVGSGGHKFYPHGLLSPNVHICSDWLITKMANIQNFYICTTVMKLGTCGLGLSILNVYVCTCTRLNGLRLFKRLENLLHK